MINPRIEKVNGDITRTKVKILEYQAKLREFERQKIDLENQEIIALYRKEKFNDDEFAALLHSQRKQDEAMQIQTLENEKIKPTKKLQQSEEENQDVFTEN